MFEKMSQNTPKPPPAAASKSEKKGFNPQRLAFLQKLQEKEDQSRLSNSNPTMAKSVPNSIPNSANNSNKNSPKNRVNRTSFDDNDIDSKVPSAPSSEILRSVPKPRKSDGNVGKHSQSRTKKVHSAFGAGLNINLAALRPGAAYGL